MRRAVIAAAALTLVAAAVTAPFASPASAEVATDFYVATTGSDANSCTTSDAPCLTVGTAVTLAQDAITTDGPLDVAVNIAAGTYTENVVIGVVASGSSLSLVGDAASTTTIHGDGAASVISITSGTVDLSGLTITGGIAVDGGGIYNDGGTLTVSDSTVSDNTAIGVDAGSGGGGGIYNNGGTLTVSDSAVSDNTASGSGTYEGGGGIYNSVGTVTITDSTVSSNAATAGYAGAIYNNTGIVTVTGTAISVNTGWYVGGVHNRGTLHVTGSTVSDNSSTNNFGGGISNYGGTMTVSDSTLADNSATNINTGKGGAIYNKGPATVTNSTLSGNSAYQGGGIYTQSKLLTVSNSTLSGNTQIAMSEGKALGGGVYAAGSPGVNISNSILSGSSCNQTNQVVDGGYNVSDDNCFWVIGPTSINDSTTIGLAALAANGSTGPQTMAIASSSSAHHFVPAAACTSIVTDERGLPRPGFGGTADCDAGAFELQGTAPTMTTVGGGSTSGCRSTPFPDVSMSSQFCGDIAWLKTQNITRGYADGNFHPAASVTRQAVAAFLHRLADPGKTTPSCTTRPFPDVPTSSQFCGDIAWLKTQNITRGYADGDFRPAASVTREAIAAFLERFTAVTENSGLFDTRVS